MPPPKLLVAIEIALLVAIGALLYAAQLYVGSMGFLAFVSTTPWILLLVISPSRSWVPAYLILVYLVSLIIVAWLSSFSVASWLVAPIPYLPFFLPLALTTRYLARRRPSASLALTWAVLFTSTEWLRIQLSPGEISLGQLGSAVADYPYLIQIVDVFGVSILTFLLAGTAGLLADLLLLLRDRRRRVPWGSVAVFSTLLTFTLIYGFVRYDPGALTPGPVVAVVQPNAPSWLDRNEANRTDAKLESLTRLAIAVRPVDLIVWPENSIGSAYLDRRIGLIPPHKRRLMRLAAEFRLPLLVDGPSVDDAGHVFHTATLIRPDGTLARHDKVKLVPWSEYVPLAKELAFFSPDLAADYISMVRGADPDLEIIESGTIDQMRPLSFKADDGTVWRFGVANCFEITSASFMNDWNKFRSPDEKRAISFIVSPANEILLGGSIHLQTLRAAKLRAVESRITVIRATDNGISALIDPNGKIADLVRDSVSGQVVSIAGFARFRVRLDRRRTLYSLVGDAFPIFCILVSLMLCINVNVLGRFLRR